MSEEEILGRNRGKEERERERERERETVGMGNKYILMTEIFINKIIIIKYII